MSVESIDSKDNWSGISGNAGRFRLKDLFIPPQGQKVVPTSAGIILILIGLCLGLAAYNTENNILFAAFSVLLSAIIISGVICWANFKNLRWRIETGKTYRVGEEGEISLCLRNESNKFSVMCFRFDVELEEQGIVKPLYLAGRLGNGEEENLICRFTPRQRSVTQVKLDDVVSSFPFGFLSKHASGNCTKEITVWPARVDYTKLSSEGGGIYWQGSSSSEKGVTGELLNHRQYERGDAPKMINWKASARQGKLIVKQNALEKQNLYAIHVDPSSFLWGGNEIFERMCSFAASFAEDLFRLGRLENCSVEGVASIKIRRVVDLESFFDVVSRLQINRSINPIGDRRIHNSITFAPLEAGSVGAFLNGKQVAQA
ncbi:DUF58 domain-containing protein [Puniceicoccaceae bacterium K14]|nr:DUF58 domain-containing protein [Puniceicoccaceae bacterium K14]